MLADACTEILDYEIYRDTVSPVVPGMSPLVAREPWLPFVDEVPDDGTYHYLVVANLVTGPPIESEEMSVDVNRCRASSADLPPGEMRAAVHKFISHMRRTHGWHAASGLVEKVRQAYLSNQWRTHSLQPRRTIDMATKNGFFRNAVDALVEARQRQVSRYVNGALLQLDDESLKILGRTREEINREGYQTYFF